MEPQGPQKKKLPLIPILIVLIVIFAGVGIYFLINKEGGEPQVTGPEVTAGPKSGEIGYVEPVQTVKVGTEEISKGNFQKFENGRIFYQDGGGVYQLPTTIDEIAVNCTNQSLDAVTELDFNQIVKVRIFSAETIVGKIPDNEPIVVFATDVDGVLTAYTIVMKSSSCPE